MKDCDGVSLIFSPHPPKVTTGEHEVISLEHEEWWGNRGMLGLLCSIGD